MNNEPIEAQEVRHLTLDQLFELSLHELRKMLGKPIVIVEATPQGDNSSPRQAIVEANIKDAQ